jgi:hypothetical protein
MIEVRAPAGRLITFAVSSPVDDGNADAAALELRRCVQSVTGRVVVVTDLTTARTLAPATAERFILLMKSDNPRLERSAIMLGAASATFAMQVERMVREAGNPARRTFRDGDLLTQWLLEVLSEQEQAALRDFMNTSTSAGE